MFQSPDDPTEALGLLDLPLDGVEEGEAGELIFYVLLWATHWSTLSCEGLKTESEIRSTQIIRRSKKCAKSIKFRKIFIYYTSK